MRLNSLSVNLTTRCSLNCKYCLALTPKAKKEKIIKDLKVSEFKNALKILEEYIEEINEYSVVGGEPLLNKEINSILESMLDSEINFRVINILTNGTVPIAGTLLDLIKNNKIKVTIDDYGNKLTEKEQEIIKGNIENLKKEHVNYAVIDNTNGTWYDYGDFEDRKLSAKEIEKRFAECVTGECIVLTPECYLGRCGRHMSTISVFGGTKGKKEYVDILNDKENIKDKLVEVLTAKTLTACNYCNGFGLDNIVCAGEQE